MPNGTLNRNYVKNMCQWLKDHGYAPKYDHAGIYCIKLNNQLVYIGKSHNMLQRVAQQYDAITEEIGQKEGEYIRKYLPPLNTQIPKEEDWRKFEVRKINEQEIIKALS